jgi:hypothetical protein
MRAWLVSYRVNTRRPLRAHDLALAVKAAINRGMANSTTEGAVWFRLM